MFDFDPWLHPLDGANPSGAELRNDQRFHDLERLMQPRIEVSRDDRNNPVSQTEVPVDWNEVLRKAGELRGSGRDLRLLVIVARALANTSGLAGLADGLTVIARNIELHWDSMHPALRAGPPREAALRRINALHQLQNEDGLLGDLRRTVFLAPRGVGPLTGRELERATLDARTAVAETATGLGAAEQARIAAEHEALIGRVRAGCAAEVETGAAAYAALVADARATADALAAVEQALNAGLGETASVALPDLGRFLARLLATLARPQTASEGPQPAGDRGTSPEPGRAMPPPSASGAFPDRLATRDEVVRCLDLIIAFYDRTEPSSPIPHLARRVRRMVPMDFLELMEDLAPSGLKEFRLLAGVAETKSKPAQKGETG